VVIVNLVVSSSAFDCLERRLSTMTAHSVTVSIITLPLFRSRSAVAVSICPFHFRCGFTWSGIGWKRHSVTMNATAHVVTNNEKKTRIVFHRLYSVRTGPTAEFLTFTARTKRNLFSQQRHNSVQLQNNDSVMLENYIRVSQLSL